MKIVPSLILISFLFFFSCKKEKGAYICTPCDLACDALTFSAPGTCPECDMALILPEKELVLNEITIQTGSGAFLLEGGTTNEHKPIKVFYHKPQNFTPTSKILLVIPGAGRNGNSYRDAWIEESEKYGLLILSPMYAEDDYDFGEYHIGGLIHELNLENSIEYEEHTNSAKLDEAAFSFKVNANKEAWIFNDFDRIFDLVVKKLNSTQSTYDLFGHSAGGHILHRFAIFQLHSKANRILASNASFYTLPTNEYSLPFGLKEAPIDEEIVKAAFAKKLVVFLGELDNETEVAGTFLRSTTADKQGLHRLERGRFFFESAKARASELGVDFNWELVVVPNVGHSHRNMGDAAGIYLYEN